ENTDERDRWQTYALTAAVIFASALLTANYIKDEILSTAGVFYALATYTAARGAFALAPRLRPNVARIAAGALIALAVLWSLRVSDLACEVRYRAFVKRNDWVAADFTTQEYTPEERVLGMRMRRAYIGIDVPPPPLVINAVPCLIREP